MSAASFTPGPWVHYPEDNIITAPDAHPHGRLIEWQARSLCVTVAERDANARLIAAAPDLLAVAIGYQRVRDAQRAYFKSRSQADLIASKQAEKELDALAKAAIEKATS